MHVIPPPPPTHRPLAAARWTRPTNELGDKSLGVLFTKAMIEDLSGKADHPNRDYVNTEELSSYVRFGCWK